MRDIGECKMLRCDQQRREDEGRSAPRGDTFHSALDECYPLQALVDALGVRTVRFRQPGRGGRASEGSQDGSRNSFMKYGLLRRYDGDGGNGGKEAI